MVDLSKYTVSIEQNDALDFVATVKEYPNIRIVEDSYKAAYNSLVDAIDGLRDGCKYESSATYSRSGVLTEMRYVLTGGITLDDIRNVDFIPYQERTGFKSFNGTSQEEYKNP